MIAASSCSCPWPIHWSRVLSWEWWCSWSSADRRCSNYISVINFIAISGASSYIKGLTAPYLGLIDELTRGPAEALQASLVVEGKFHNFAKTAIKNMSVWLVVVRWKNKPTTDGIYDLVWYQLKSAGRSTSRRFSNDVNIFSWIEQKRNIKHTGYKERVKSVKQLHLSSNLPYIFILIENSLHHRCNNNGRHDPHVTLMYSTKWSWPKWYPEI